MQRCGLCWSHACHSLVFARTSRKCFYKDEGFDQADCGVSSGYASRIAKDETGAGAALIYDKGGYLLYTINKEIGDVPFSSPS